MGWFIRVLFAGILFIVYVTISAEGMRSLFDIAATPLHKTGLWPLTYLGGFAETRKLDIAHVLCVALMIVVWVAWEMIVVINSGAVQLTNSMQLIWAGGVVVLVCDAVLFWVGISQGSLLAETTIFASTVLTAMYVAMLVLVATWTNMLEGRIR